jgi:UPF0755 protein
MRTNFKVLIAMIISIGVLIGIALVYFYYGVWKKPILTDREDKELFIPTGATLKSLLDSVYTWPMRVDTSSFALLARTKDLDKRLKPGRYIISKNATINELINQLRSGNQAPVRVTFSHISSFQELAGKIAEYIEADSTSLLVEFFRTDRQWPDGIAHTNQRGVFIPNTYEMYWNTSAEGFVERMIIEYHRFWTDERREKAAAQNLSPHEVIILASIVEKETVKQDEMPKVAGLYLNRLRKNWKLQSDPTVIFAKQQVDPSFVPQRVLYSDLEYDSPYNTYKYFGLPPGPIGFPSTKALNAVLNPEIHNYFYMCANPDSPGYHSFARNDREHNTNKQKYIQWLQKQGIRR